MDPNSWTPFVQAAAVKQWDPDRRSDPHPVPRRNGRRMSGETWEDEGTPPIIDGGRLYGCFMPGGEHSFGLAYRLSPYDLSASTNTISETEYLLPIDGAEQDRLDFCHQFYKILLDGNLSIVPFEKPPKWVLDIGTGTGIWAIEFAKENPTSFVLGTDLSAIQPRPPPLDNCAWIQENSEKQEWSYWEPLDYIHLRATGPCFDDLSDVLQKCYDNLQPGGWIELQDGALDLKCDDGTAMGTSLPEFFWAMNNGAQRLGRDLNRSTRFHAYLEKAGFVNIQVIELAAPGSPWPEDPKMKLCGYYVGRAIYAAADSYRKFLETARLIPEEIDGLIKRIEKDMSSIDIHWYVQL